MSNVHDLPVEPDISHHAVLGRPSARGQGGVPHDGFGVGIPVVGIGVVDPFAEETADAAICV